MLNGYIRRPTRPNIITQKLESIIDWTSSCIVFQVPSEFFPGTEWCYYPFSLSLLCLRDFLWCYKFRPFIVPAVIFCLHCLANNYTGIFVFVARYPLHSRSLGDNKFSTRLILSFTERNVNVLYWVIWLTPPNQDNWCNPSITNPSSLQLINYALFVAQLHYAGWHELLSFSRWTFKEI